MYNRHALVRRFRENVDREPGGARRRGSWCLFSTRLEIFWRASAPPSASTYFSISWSALGPAGVLAAGLAPSGLIGPPAPGLGSSSAMIGVPTGSVAPR